MLKKHMVLRLFVLGIGLISLGLSAVDRIPAAHDKYGLRNEKTGLMYYSWRGKMTRRALRKRVGVLKNRVKVLENRCDNIKNHVEGVAKKAITGGSFKKLLQGISNDFLRRMDDVSPTGAQYEERPYFTDDSRRIKSAPILSAFPDYFWDFHVPFTTIGGWIRKDYRNPARMRSESEQLSLRLQEVVRRLVTYSGLLYRLLDSLSDKGSIEQFKNELVSIRYDRDLAAQMMTSYNNRLGEYKSGDQRTFIPMVETFLDCSDLVSEYSEKIRSFTEKVSGYSYTPVRSSR